jgi:hypothetical protein
VQESRPELVAITEDELAFGDLGRLVAEMEAVDQRFKYRSPMPKAQRLFDAIRRRFRAR